ncbi:hypothetical protein K1719_002570 [Acacia pycnantha]|nr:hypothetical protein K1719_002570 [Acacia pycnantha]
MSPTSELSPHLLRWGFIFQPQWLPYCCMMVFKLYMSSTSINEKDDRDWVRGNDLYNLHYSASDDIGLMLSCPSDIYQGPQWTPPAIHEISIDDCQNSTRKGNSEF